MIPDKLNIFKQHKQYHNRLIQSKLHTMKKKKKDCTIYTSFRIHSIALIPRNYECETIKIIRIDMYYVDK